ncbi:homoserine kinase [Ascoidea rubescens DSM 1968]|uniref:Homoserine kinase n=1 Tax=Ascoidea rubescens DSM 1968 TaxID=1344418 RepID=A0A1D2VI65_9ASCO|nr:homoserine kinase [Ascoidea rubescens DSM 1968]ODV61305.1 homoserine kinase [Ascoidea rubescens DSM 1968]
MHSRKFEIKVPASSANIGPGFDVLGIGLNLFLVLNVTVDSSAIKDKSLNFDVHNCLITYEGEGAEDVPLDSDENLITRTALYVLRCHNIREFPAGTFIHVSNPIPLGRGLGSSGAAVVAGALLANEIGKFNLSRSRCLDFCLMIERHPDNITAAMMGGFVGSYLRELSATELERKEIPLAEVLPQPAGGEDTGLVPPIPPFEIGHHIKYNLNKKIKFLTIIPNFELSTATSRDVLPSAYTRKDLVFNLQRIAVLTTAITLDPPNPELIYSSMQDRIHQPYRKTLVPGLSEILNSMSPNTNPGLLGICLSGAGPTILALVTENYSEIADEIINRFKKNGITCTWKLLEPAYDGATVTEL